MDLKKIHNGQVMRIEVITVPSYLLAVIFLKTNSF